MPASRQLALHLLILYDALRDVHEEAVDDKDEDTASEQNSRNDQIGFPEDADQEIADQKKNEQDDRNIEDAALLAPFLSPFHIARKVHKSVDVVHHKNTSEIYHAVDNDIHNLYRPPFKKPNCIHGSV